MAFPRNKIENESHVPLKTSESHVSNRLVCQGYGLGPVERPLVVNMWPLRFADEIRGGSNVVENPSILSVLGLDPEELAAVQIEGTQKLPGFGRE